MQTELTLSRGGLPPMSARGCIQELKSLPQGEFKRTINGELVFIGHGTHKYISTVKCTDQTVMATEGLQIGDEIIVGCIQQLCQKIPPHSKSLDIILERIPIPQSIYIIDEKKKDYLDFRYKNNSNKVHISPFSKDLFIFYNPQLRMRVLSFILTTDEWNMKTGWTLELEEI